MILIFVYGSLKQGFGNHRFINQSPLFNATLKDYVLLTQDIGYPAIMPGEGLVEGEVYQIDDETTQTLDRLEQHPTYYCRQSVRVIEKDTLKMHQAFTYVIVNPSGWRPYGKTNWKR